MQDSLMRFVDQTGSNLSQRQLGDQETVQAEPAPGSASEDASMQPSSTAAGSSSCEHKEVVSKAIWIRPARVKARGSELVGGVLAHQFY